VEGETVEEGAEGKQGRRNQENINMKLKVMMDGRMGC